jgi:hypothetical protein
MAVAGCVVKAAHSQKVLCFLACGIRTWDSRILGSSAVTVNKSLKADVLEDVGGRLFGEGSKFSEGIMIFGLWDSNLGFQYSRQLSCDSCQELEG